MAYVRNEPVASDDLTVSQPKLATNTNSSDDSFGVDHYKFSNTTSSNGFHNQVTTPQFFASTTIPPVYPTVLPVTVANPVLFAFQPTDGAGTPTTNIGLLQYSQGPNNAVPTPITTLQSPLAGINLAFNATSNVLDFTGAGITTFALAVLYVIRTGTLTSNSFMVSFVAGGSKFVGLIGPNPLSSINAQFSGNVLQIKNNFGAADTFYWTLQFIRIQ